MGTTLNFLSALGIGLIVASLAGCERITPPEPPPAGSAAPAISSWPATQRTDKENFSVTILPTGGVIERNRHFSLDVTVESGRESADHPAAGDLTLAIDADMPAHRHGMNTQPEIAQTGDRRYRVDGMRFHMAGRWVISVDIAHGTESERASFPVDVE